MKNKILLLIATLMMCLPIEANTFPCFYNDKKSGDRYWNPPFRYSIERDYKVSIIGYDTTQTANSITIPDLLYIENTKFNVIIKDSPFKRCNSLTEINFSSRIERIGSKAFNGCRNLKKINIDPKNTKYTSVDGILFNKDKTILLRVPEGISGNFVIQSNITEIGDFAFNGCSNLTNRTDENQDSQKCCRIRQNSIFRLQKCGC